MVTRRFEGGHSCRLPGRQQDRAHQGRSHLGGHPRNQLLSQIIRLVKLISTCNRFAV